MSVGKILRKSLPFANVSASGIATASVTVGRTIEGFMLLMGGTTFSSANISLVRIKVNGKQCFEATGAQIDKIAKFQGLTYPATLLPIIFTEIAGRDWLDEMVGAWDTSAGVANITMEVTIAGATAPTLDSYVIESAPQAGGVGNVMTKVLRYPYSVAAGGLLSIPLPFGPVNGAVIKRIHIEYGVANNLTACTVKENGVVVHESVFGLMQAYNQFYRGVNQTNTYHIDFLIDENGKNAMDTRADRTLELLPTFAAADSGFVFVEYLDTLGNL